MRKVAVYEVYRKGERMYSWVVYKLIAIFKVSSIVDEKVIDGDLKKLKASWHPRQYQAKNGVGKEILWKMKGKSNDNIDGNVKVGIYACVCR